MMWVVIISSNDVINSSALWSICSKLRVFWCDFPYVWTSVLSCMLFEKIREETWRKKLCHLFFFLSHSALQHKKILFGVQTTSRAFSKSGIRLFLVESCLSVTPSLWKATLKAFFVFYLVLFPKFHMLYFLWKGRYYAPKTFLCNTLLEGFWSLP